MDVDGFWHDYHCAYAANKKPYICEGGRKIQCELKYKRHFFSKLMLEFLDKILSNCLVMWTVEWRDKFFVPLCTLSACPAGFEENDGNCYKHVTTTATGDAAQAACVADGANLVSIEDTAENDFIQEKFG